MAPSTVSKALRDDPRISAATRARIQALAAEVGYMPSTAASSLRTRRTMTIGMVIRDYADPYNGLLLRAIETTALRAGYQLLVASTHAADLREVDIARMFRQRRVDGIIVVASHVDESHSQLDPTVPVVFINEKPELLPDRPHVGLVALDDRAGGRTITQHLIGLGHRRIAYVAMGRASLSSLDRQRGYEEALRAARIEPDPSLVVTASRWEAAEGGAEAVEMLLPVEPTAIFFYNDLSAIGGLRALLDRGVRVPDQISIVGFDDLEVSALVSPPLTTMAQPRTEMGRMATEQLMSMIRGEVESVRADAACVLVVRRSTAHPAVAAAR